MKPMGWFLRAGGACLYRRDEGLEVMAPVVDQEVAPVREGARRGQARFGGVMAFVTKAVEQWEKDGRGQARVRVRAMLGGHGRMVTTSTTATVLGRGYGGV